MVAKNVERYLNKFKFTEKICELQNNQISLWNYSWVKGKNMLNILNNTSIFLQAEFDKLDNIIPNNEIDLFDY